MVGITAVLVVAVCFSAQSLRVAMGIGVAAGTAAAVVKLPSATTVSGPFGVAVAQTLLKALTGALTAWLGVLLIVYGGIAVLKVDETGVVLYAIIFGSSQQLLTQMVDKQVTKLGASTTASGSVPATAGNQ
jgi:hypothetical protein